MPDEEVFGPLLRVWRMTISMKRFEWRITLASASLASGFPRAGKIRSTVAGGTGGVVNWNKPLTGAASTAPFGGIALPVTIAPAPGMPQIIVPGRGEPGVGLVNIARHTKPRAGFSDEVVR